MRVSGLLATIALSVAFAAPGASRKQQSRSHRRITALSCRRLRVAGAKWQQRSSRRSGKPTPASRRPPRDGKGSYSGQSGIGGLGDHARRHSAHDARPGTARCCHDARPIDGAILRCGLRPRTSPGPSGWDRAISGRSAVQSRPAVARLCPGPAAAPANTGFFEQYGSPALAM